MRYLRTLRWVPIPVGVGFAYIGYQQFGHVVEREERKIRNATSVEEVAAKDWQVRNEGVRLLHSNFMNEAAAK